MDDVRLQNAHKRGGGGGGENTQINMERNFKTAERDRQSETLRPFFDSVGNNTIDPIADDTKGHYDEHQAKTARTCVESFRVCAAVNIVLFPLPESPRALGIARMVCAATKGRSGRALLRT